MSKQFPHIYSFRLSNADVEEYTWLLKHFYLDSCPDKSRAFRGLIRELRKAFTEMKFQPRLAQVLAAAQAPGIRDPSAPGLECTDEEDEELSIYSEEPWENQNNDPDYHRLRQIAVKRMMSRSQGIFEEDLLKEIEQLRKEGKKSG